MIGLVLVSHSRKLAESVKELVLQMTTPHFPVAVASGAGEDHNQMGTDAVHIADVIKTMRGLTGVLVLMDLGSAVLSAQTAIELIDSPFHTPILLCAAPLVEGAIAAAVQANAGGTLEEVAREAQRGLMAKQQQLQSESANVSPAVVSTNETQRPAAASGETAELVLTVENEHGLHARPAAIFVQTVSRFTSSVEVSNLTSGRGPAPARSLTSIALLQVRKGDRIRVTASGTDRDAALRAIRELATNGFGEKTDGSSHGASDIGVVELVTTQSHEPPLPSANGVPGSEGIAIGPLLLLHNSLHVADDAPAGEPAAELAKLVSAMKVVSEQFHQRAQASSDATDILAAQALILNDPVLLDKLKVLIQGKRLSAAQAWTKATEELAAQYQEIDDSYLRERGADIRDIARRVLRKMQGKESSVAIALDRPAILLADELLPSEAAACDASKVLGVIARSGSATSHSAIILRTLGIPMVVGVTWLNEKSAVGKTVAIDGATGQVWVEPDEPTRAMLQERKQAQLARKKLAYAERSQPCITLDGTRIEVLANVGNARDAAAAEENGAEGIGLLRTEILFLSYTHVPSEEEQRQAISEICAPISGPAISGPLVSSPIIVRTFDVGADKPVSFLPQPEERNPYLGVRGIRLSLKSPEFFLTHLRAILTAGAHSNLWLMFPMIATLEEARDALRLLDRAHRELEGARQPHAWPIKRGIMIEVPSAALMSAQLAEDLDFFSIGTNDLTQYSMAAERGNAAVAELQDPLHPAVLHLIRFVVEGAKTRNRHVSVCGDAASDPLAAAVFTGLGIRSLSVRPKQVAGIKALLRCLSVAELQLLAEKALQCCEAARVRSLARDTVDAATHANRSLVTDSGS